MLAKDLTSETFLAAVEAARRSEAVGGTGVRLTLPWLIGIARHKLAELNAVHHEVLSLR